MQNYIIVIDCSTSACKSLLINKQGEIVGKVSKKISQYFPKSGWCEQSAEEIWENQIETLRELKNIYKFKVNEIAAIAITNQRETVVAWDVETKSTVNNAIVWQDKRGYKLCEELIKQNYSQTINQKTGLIINPYFSASKIHWLIQNNSTVQQKIKNKTLLIGTVDSWLIWNLTYGKSFVTDVTNASRTMLFNIHTLSWDDELLRLFNIPKEILPEVKLNNVFCGNARSCWITDEEPVVNIPIYGVIGDQSSSLFGSKCFETYDVKNTYGTGCFLMMNTGEEPVFSNNNLLTTIAWKINGSKAVYALEGSIFNAGSVFDWLINDLQIVKDCSEIEDICSKYLHENHVHFVTAFTGLGAPYWNYNARGSVFGIEIFTKKDDIVKAAVDSIAFQTNDLLNSINKDLSSSLNKDLANSFDKDLTNSVINKDLSSSVHEDVGQKITTMFVDGGLSNSEYLMNFQSGLSNIKIKKLIESDLTSLGAFYLAGLGIGWWKSLDDIKKINSDKKIYSAIFEVEKIESLTAKWAECLAKNYT